MPSPLINPVDAPMESEAGVAPGCGAGSGGGFGGPGKGLSGSPGSSGGNIPVPTTPDPNIPRDFTSRDYWDGLRIPPSNPEFVAHYHAQVARIADVTPLNALAHGINRLLRALPWPARNTATMCLNLLSYPTTMGTVGLGVAALSSAFAGDFISALSFGAGALVGMYCAYNMRVACVEMGGRNREELANVHGIPRRADPRPDDARIINSPYR